MPQTQAEIDEENRQQLARVYPNGQTEDNNFGGNMAKSYARAFFRSATVKKDKAIAKGKYTGKVKKEIEAEIARNCNTLDGEYDRPYSEETEKKWRKYGQEHGW